MHQYGWKIEYCMTLTKSQILLFVSKINKRIEREVNFQKSLHGAKVENLGLDTTGAIPIEDVIDGKTPDNLLI
jgi:hypothetical protein